MSPLALEGDVPDYQEKANVKRVERVLGDTGFEHLFPLRNEIYTYEGFLRAVGKWPAFCGERGDGLKTSAGVAYTDD